MLLQPALRALNIAEQGSGVFVDATFGRGGHSTALLKNLASDGRLLALDQDPSAAAAVSRAGHFDSDPRFSFQQTNFRHLSEALQHAGVNGQVNGILFDLGVSSPQLDNPERGFSFRHDGPLDMRMAGATDSDAMTAAQWLATASEQQLQQTLRDYGEERFARRIAKTIMAVQHSSRGPITRTLQLAELIDEAVPRARREPGKHPATRSFQAIRIAVNDELGALEQALEQTIAALAPGGRLVVISFHSLEDRIVKQFMRRQARGAALPDRLPVTAAQAQAAAGARLSVLDRVRPDADEIAANPRARSAVLRVAERLA